MDAGLKTTDDDAKHRRPELRHEMRMASFKVERPSEKARLMAVIKTTAHANNMILLLGKELETCGQPASVLRDPAVIRALAAGTAGGKKAEAVTMVRETLGEHQMFQAFLATCQRLKEKNLHAVGKKIAAAFKSFATKMKKGDERARPPQAKKLSRLHSYAIPIDQCAFSLKRKNTLRINLNQKMESFALSHAAVASACGSLAAVQSLEIALVHGEVYFCLGYKVLAPELSLPSEPKRAGIDLGLKNTMSLFVEDTETPSLIVEGSPLIQYNAQFNRRLSKLVSQRDCVQNSLAGLSEDKTAEQESLRCKLGRLNHSIGKRFAERQVFFRDHFHKLAVRCLEYCRQAGVSELFLSRNLGFLKQEEGGGRVHNQKFCQIPMVKLVDYLKDNGAAFGILVRDDIDEAYTSKSSCISADVCAIQQVNPRSRSQEAVSGKSSSPLSNAFGGRREKRDVFHDTVISRRFLADLNGAANHIKLGVGQGHDLSWLRDHLWKLVNPIVLKCDSMFLDLRFRRSGDREEKPESRQSAWLYATWLTFKPLAQV